MSPSRTPLRRREPTRRNRGHLTILDAMDDENLFAPHFDNAESWVAWRAFLAVLFGFPLDEQQRELFRQCTGREHINSEGHHEASTLKELGEMLAHVVEHMATKDALKEFREETAENFRALRAEVADIRRDLDDLRSRVVNVTGYRKEIDYALERIAAIEKHLGIERKVAA